MTTNGGPPLLEIEGVVKRFGGITALNGCSFAVAEGSITGLIGPNGSGKTTLFNIITGLHPPDEGTIRLRGRGIAGLRPHQICRMGVGRTFQVTRLFPTLTVLENMVVPTRGIPLRGIFAPGVMAHEEERAMGLLEFVGLAEFRDKEARELSFGQQKLLELASGLMLDPSILLLDEPTGGVNPVIIERIMDRIRQLNRGGTTVLLVEHNMKVVMELCDPVLVLDNGELICQGTAAEVQKDPRVLDAYLGD